MKDFNFSLICLSGSLVYFTRPISMHRTVPPTEPTPRWIFNPVCSGNAILLYDTLARVLRWSLCVCAGLCQLSRRITADWWRPWKCERSLRPPWGCTAGAQHAQTKTKCPYRPFTTKNGWDLSHRTEISPGGKLV